MQILFLQGTCWEKTLGLPSTLQLFGESWRFTCVCRQGAEGRTRKGPKQGGHSRTLEPGQSLHEARARGQGMRVIKSLHWGPHQGPEHGDGHQQEELTQMSLSA